MQSENRVLRMVISVTCLHLAHYNGIHAELLGPIGYKASRSLICQYPLPTRKRGGANPSLDLTPPFPSLLAAGARVGHKLYLIKQIPWCLAWLGSS